MKQLKSLLKNISDRFYDVLHRYPVTMALILVTSAIAAVFLDGKDALSVFMSEKGMIFTFLWGLGTFFVETIFTEKKPLKWLALAAAGLISASLVFLTNSGSDLTQENAAHFAAAYGITLVLLGVWQNSRKSEQPFNEYCLRVVYGLSRLAILCFIVAAGLSLIVSVFVVLILDPEYYSLIFRVEVLVMGSLAGCGFLASLIHKEETLPRFYLTIVRRVLVPLLVIAFAIIYGYILKIVITRIVPSNEIFRILAGLFLIGLPIWTIAGTDDNRGWLSGINRKLPFIFIPFLFLQGYAIRERIAAFGMTPFRYLCLALMLFEVIYIVLYGVRRKAVGMMLPVAAALAVISQVLPYGNMYQVSNRSQKAIFDRYIDAEFASLPLENKSSLSGAYYYLAGNPEGKSMLASIDPEKINAIRDSGMTGDLSRDQTIQFSRVFPLVDADISDFSSLTLISADEPNRNFEDGEIDLSAVRFYDDEENETLTVDLRGFIDETLSWYESGNIPDAAVIEIDDSRQIWLNSCWYLIDENQHFRYLTLSGLLLTK